MESTDQRRLEQNFRYLQENLTDIPDIVHRLIELHVLRLGDVSIPHTTHNKSQEVANLLTRLNEIPGSYASFIQVLKERKFDWIVEHLEKTHIEEPVPMQESTNSASVLVTSLDVSQNLSLHHAVKVFPIQNENFTGRTKELKDVYNKLHLTSPEKRKHESKKHHATGSQMLRIYGGGGRGKSQIALQYAHLHQHEYQLIRWVPSGKDSIKSSMVSFAKDLNIAVENVDDAELLRRIFKVLRSYDTWLLIYDNAGSHDDIKPYLPDTNHLKEGQHIILTSLSPLGASSPSYEVLVFTPEDAYEYVSERLKAKEHPDANNESAIRSLTHLLGYLPLALSQAVAYIKVHLLCTIDDYLKSYERNHSRMMEKNIHFENHANKSVFLTHITSVGDILGTPDDPMGEPFDGKKQNPATLLKCLSFLNCEEIPVALLRDSELFSDEDFDDAMGELRKFSLISQCRLGCIRIHKLVQIVVRKYKRQDPNLTDDPRDDFCQYALRPLTVALINKLPKDCSCIGWRDIDGETLDMLSILLPHAQTLLSHADGALGPKLGPASDKTRSDILNLRDDLLYFIGFAAYFLRNITTARKAFEELVQICEISRTGRNERMQLAEALEMLGICNRLSQNHGNSIAYLQKALAIVEPLLENDPKLQRLRITIMTALGKTYYIKGDYHASHDELQKALKLQKQYLPNDTCLLSYILPKLGNALYGMYEDQKARTCFEKCVEVRQELYPKGHILIGSCQFCIGKVQLGFKEFPDAEENFKSSLLCAENYYGPRHSHFGKMNAALGLCFLLQQKFSDACRYLSTAEHILGQNYGTCSEVYSRVQRWLKYAKEEENISFEQIQLLFILDF